jgi:hypothetical protein
VDDREVFQDEVVRAYEFTKEQYIEVSDEDIESLPVPSKHTIELTSFVKSAEIDPVYFERTYFLEADQVGAKDQAGRRAGQDRPAQPGKPVRAARWRQRAHARDAVLPGRDPHHGVAGRA